jgi:hypothetical protein
MENPYSYRDNSTSRNLNEQRPEIGQLTAENARLRSALAESQQEVQRLTHELGKYREREAVLHNVRRSAYTGNEKVIVADLLHQVERPDVDRRGEKVRYCQETAAHRLKMGANTIGRCLASLEDTGVLEKETVKHIAPDGTIRLENYVAFNPERLREVHTIPKEETKRERRKHYPPCPSCGAERVLRRVLLCPKCQHQEVLSEINPDAPAPKDAWNVPWEEWAKSPEDETLAELAPAAHQFGEVFKQEHSLITSPESTAHQIGERVTLPALRPIPAHVEADLEGETASYLFVAGFECSAVVEMTPKAYPKYVEPTIDGKKGSEKEPWALEVLIQHLRGQRVIALKQTNQERSYLVDIDFDTPAGVQAVEAACPAMIAQGWLPLLEYSPVHGAGLRKENGDLRDSVHLILQWRSPVQVQAVLAKLDALRPDLRQHWDKVWPNFNMRLPGFYHQPDACGWCTMVSPVTDERAPLGPAPQHGPAAWRLLLSHQADPATVPDLPPDEPTPTPEKPKSGPTLNRASIPYSGQGPQFDGRDAIAWWNRTHTLDEINPRVTATHAAAIWRGEKVPSVQYNRRADGSEWWHDYGAPPTKDCDVFALWCLVQAYTKPEGCAVVMSLYRQHLLAQDRRN